jgi:hypothetical protein
MVYAIVLYFPRRVVTVLEPKGLFVGLAVLVISEVGT